MTEPLLHLTTPGEWRAALANGVIAPPSLAAGGFVHLSTREQVALPATRLFRGRTDLLALALDPARIGVEVRYEPGLPTDPDGMRFPHAYGPVPATAVLAALPYRPRPDGGFDPPPRLPGDPGGRQAVLEHSVLRRVATSEVAVTGGVGVHTATVPASHHHNQLLIDGPTSATQLAADADRVLGTDGSARRTALLAGSHLRATAAGLAASGWQVERLVGMAAPAGGPGGARAEQVEQTDLHQLWAAMWERESPGISAAAIAQLAQRYQLEEQVVDLRYLGVRDAGRVVASCLLKIDGGTAEIDALHTDAAARGRGHAAALVTEARAVAGRAGCDLVVLDALAADWPRAWYRRLGFTEVAEGWAADRPG